VNGETSLDAAVEARKQVILADRLVISKSDLAAPGALEHLMRRLRELNPRAAIDVAVAGALDAERFTAAVTAQHTGFVAEAEHSDGIVSFVLTWQEPIEWLSFARAMETLIALRGADLLRVKGLLNVAGCHGPVVVQYVQHLAHPPVELQSWPQSWPVSWPQSRPESRPDQNRESRVVFIARKIPEAAVRDLFAAVERLANTGHSTM
jgi:G3E family GTPase